MRQTRAVLAAALVCAAGCQHDLALRPGNDRNGYVSDIGDADRFIIVSDTRRVSLQFLPPPVGEYISSDTVFFYLSIPLHPLRGIEFDNPGLGLGWSNRAMAFTRVFDPAPGYSPAYAWPAESAEGAVTDWSPLRARTSADPAGLESTSVDPRYADYAAVLREDVYRSNSARGAGRLASTGAESASVGSSVAVQPQRSDDD